MLLRNHTPLAAIGFGDEHRDGMTMAVIAVRASYRLSEDGALTLANEQQIAMSDVYEGDPYRTPLLRVNDLIPYKPGADVTILGMAHAPRGEPAESWQVSVAVGSHQVRLKVHGPRQWEPALKMVKPTWRLGRADPASRVALDYRLAAGGFWVGDGEGRKDARNPLGPGVLRRDTSLVGYPLRAPQIEAPNEALDEPFAIPEPRGFGPVPPFWRWREAYLGTHDESWQRERFPLMPADMSYRFFQAAHPDLVLAGLAGDETVRLEGLVPGGRGLSFELPGVAPVADHEWFDGREVAARLKLDGLHLDMRAADGPWLADLTWRGWVTQCPAYHGASLSAVRLDETHGMPSQGEYGLDLAEAAA